MPRELALKIGSVFESKYCGKFKVVRVLTTDECKARRDFNNRYEIRFLTTGYRTLTTAYVIKSGSVKDPNAPTVCGKGYLGEGEFRSKEGMKQTALYVMWHNMIQRCYDPKTLTRYPTYVGAKVCKRWLCFQNFAADVSDMPNAGRKGFDLDKDLTTPGNKTYAPKHCSFVPHEVNKLLNRFAACPKAERTERLARIKIMANKHKANLEPKVYKSLLSLR